MTVCYGGMSARHTYSRLVEMQRNNAQNEQTMIEEWRTPITDAMILVEQMELLFLRLHKATYS